MKISLVSRDGGTVGVGVLLLTSEVGREGKGGKDADRFGLVLHYFSRELLLLVL